MNVAARSRAASPSLGWALRGLLLVLLLGIFGMHALSPHGSEASAHSATQSGPPLAGHGAAAGDMPPDGSGKPAQLEMVPVTVSSEGSDPGGSTTELCLAVLLGLGLAALLALAASRRSVRLRIRPAVWLPLSRSQFLPRPPTLSELSLLRC
jgi:MYXO-CTERM domain-containing protein